MSWRVGCSFGWNSSGGSAGVSSVVGTPDRITVSTVAGVATVDIAPTYVGQATITTVGTLTSGSLGAGFTTVAVARGGTGVTTFGGTNRILFTSTVDVLSSSANLTYDGTILGLTSGTGTFKLRSLTTDSTIPAFYLNQAVPSGTNYTLYGNGVSTILNASTSAGTLSLRVGDSARVSIMNTAFSFAQSAATSGATSQYKFTNAGNTGQTASTEVFAFEFDSSQTIQHATGALALQRATLFRAPTYSFVGASATTNMATVAITGAPISGTNNSPVNTHAFYIGAEASTDGAGTAPTNSYGITCNAQTGATNNFAAQFIGGITKLTGGITVGTGGNITDVLIATATLDFPNTAAGAQSDLTVTVTGAALNDQVFIGTPNGSVSATDNVNFWAWVSAADTVTIRFNNGNLVAAVDPASGTFKVVVFKTA